MGVYDGIHVGAGFQDFTVYASFRITRFCRWINRLAVFYVVFYEIGGRAYSPRSYELTHDEHIGLVRVSDRQMTVRITGLHVGTQRDMR